MHGEDEIDVIVEDIPYEYLDGTYQDPDVELCEFYNIDYEKVNCVELLDESLSTRIMHQFECITR